MLNQPVFFLCFADGRRKFFNAENMNVLKILICVLDVKEEKSCGKPLNQHFQSPAIFQFRKGGIA